VGVKLSGKFRIINNKTFILLYPTVYTFNFLLFLNGYQRFNGINFRRKNFPMEKYTGGRIFRCKDD
jgi:hypothetical protein